MAELHSRDKDADEMTIDDPAFVKCICHIARAIDEGVLKRKMLLIDRLG